MANHIRWWIYECEFIQKNTVRAVSSKWNSQATCFSITWDACQLCKDTTSDLRNHSVWRRDGVSASWTSTMVPLKVWEWLWTSICWATLQPQQTLVVRIREQGSKGQRRCSESMVVSELNKEKGGCSRWGRKKVTGESKKMCTRDSKNIGLPGVKERDCRVTKISLNNS